MAVDSLLELQLLEGDRICEEIYKEDIPADKLDLLTKRQNTTDLSAESRTGAVLHMCDHIKRVLDEQTAIALPGNQQPSHPSRCMVCPKVRDGNISNCWNIIQISIKNTDGVNQIGNHFCLYIHIQYDNI